jgi:chaperonin GroEL (HSP60 family)
MKDEIRMKQGNLEGEDRYATLLNNAGAIRAICAAVEGTLGPKGLDTMLVGSRGQVLVTNDGATILEQMDVTHPAARMLVQVAKSQQERVGDGTTTATVLAGALVAEGVAQVTRGVPVSKVVTGLQDGIRLATELLQARSRTLAGLHDPMLYRVAYVAAREDRQLAELVMAAAERLGVDTLRDDGYRLADSIAAHDKPVSEVWSGLLLKHKPIHAQMLAMELQMPKLLVMHDALEPEKQDEEAMMTDAGFQRYLLLKEEFQANLGKLLELDVRFIALDRGVDQEAEQFCADHGIIVLQRVPKRELQRICEHTGARPIRRTVLKKAPAELVPYLGACETLAYDARIEQVRLTGGAGLPAATVLVGGSTADVVGERARIARDAAAAVQAAVRGGYLPGGGAVEVAVAHELDRYRETVKGMEAFGVAAVVQALHKPLAQMVLNAGFNPLEQVEQVRAAQLAQQSDSIGIDCDTGQLMDVLKKGIVDPAPVKIHALLAAGEVAAAVLRIHTVIKMRSNEDG